MDVYVNRRYLGLLNVVSTRKLKKKKKTPIFSLKCRISFSKKNFSISVQVFYYLF